MSTTKKNNPVMEVQAEQPTQENPPVEDTIQKEEELEVLSKLGKEEDVTNAQLVRSQRKVSITIASGEGEGQQSRVPVGVNGHTYSIKRDEKVSVPISVYRVLAGCTTTRPVLNEAGRVVGFRDVPRFAITVHDM